MPSAGDVVLEAAQSRGEIEISLWSEEWMDAAIAAETEGLVKIDAAGLGDRTILTLTEKGRALVGLPLKSFVRRLLRA